jgi:hypothetical protein
MTCDVMELRKQESAPTSARRREIAQASNGRTIVATAIGETNDAIGEAMKSVIGLGARADGLLMRGLQRTSSHVD